MNAAAKIIQPYTIFNGQMAKLRPTKVLFIQSILMVLVLFSAVAVVYSTNMNRMAFSQLQASEHKTHELQVQWGKLLLEQASLSTPGRVEKLATTTLRMHVPYQQQVVILHIK